MLQHERENAIKSDPNSAAVTAKEIKSLLSLHDPLTSVNESADATRLDHLRRIFSRVIATGELSLTFNKNYDGMKQIKSDVQVKWNAWLKKNFDDFLSQLRSGIQMGRKSALRTFMGVIASSPAPVVAKDDMSPITENGRAKKEMLNETLIYYMLKSLTHPTFHDKETEETNDEEVGHMHGPLLSLLENEFIIPYRDVQYFLLVSIRHLASKVYVSENSRQRTNRHEHKDQMVSTTEAEKALEMRRAKHLGIIAENLLRILIQIDIALSEEELLPMNVKDGICSNYLFLPPVLIASVSSKATLTIQEGKHEAQNENNTEDENNSDDSENSIHDQYSDESEEDVDNVADGGKRKRQSIDDHSCQNQSKKSSWQSLSRHRRAFQAAYISVLKLPHIPLRSVKRVLQHIPSGVFPFVSSPLRFAEFCTRSYEVGGITSLLALHGLFILMVQHGLEYPNFYVSLYKLIDIQMFYSKHRTRFFRLLTKCLTGNQMLPAYAVAAFCKKLGRYALSAPPSGALFVLALISNLLRKHQECACLIHRGIGDRIKDPYDIEAEKPIESKAIESSLWELNALEKHYHPAVRTLARSCGIETEQTLMHNLEEFLLHTYKSLFEQERKREKKKGNLIPLTFKSPAGLFVTDDVFDGIFNGK